MKDRLEEGRRDHSQKKERDRKISRERERERLGGIVDPRIFYPFGGFFLPVYFTRRIVGKCCRSTVRRTTLCDVCLVSLAPRRRFVACTSDEVRTRENKTRTRLVFSRRGPGHGPNAFLRPGTTSKIGLCARDRNNNAHGLNSCSSKRARR